MTKVAVIGAGVVGLSTAINIQRAVPQAQVTILADRFGPETCSSGAGGIFRVYMTEDLEAEGVSQEVVKGWIRDSWDFCRYLATSPHAEEAGAYFVTGTAAYTTPKDKEYAFMKELCVDFHTLSRSDMEKMKLGHRYSYGYRFTTIMTQSAKYQNWLMKQFKDAGGVVKNKTVKSFAELSRDYDVVANCCGLRSKDITGDDSSYPVKGHLVHLHAPWIKEFFMSDEPELIHYLPHDDKLVVGGIKEAGNYDLTPDPEVRKTILSRIEALFPQLKGAKVIGEWCGLRPCRRGGLRLGKELVDCGAGRKLPVVHNYGHGGRGVFMGWGCGKAAAKHVQEILLNGSARL